jgi:hypothetical protein
MASIIFCLWTGNNPTRSGLARFILTLTRLRLVLPPPMFAVLQFLPTRLLHVLFSPAIANGLISGLFVACKWLFAVPRYNDVLDLDFTC